MALSSRFLCSAAFSLGKRLRLHSAAAEAKRGSSMNSSPVIVHEWFDEGGPDTFEYLLPVTELPQDHDRLTSDWTREFVGKESSDAKRLYDHFLGSVETAQNSKLISVLRRLRPFSLIVQGSQHWLLCKLHD